MTPLKGIDFAWTKISAAEAKAAGVAWAAGYFSNDDTKNLTHAVVADYFAHGLGIVGVWETTTTRATQGRNAGVSDAHSALLEAAACGLPSDCIIYFAVDEDTTWTSSIQAYFDGAASIIGLARTGCYGGYLAVSGAAAHKIPFLWQTSAWSGGKWLASANIRQEGGTLFGGAADLDYAEKADYGQAPRPKIVTPPEDDFMTLFANVAAFEASVTKAATAALESQPGRDAIANAGMWWWDHILNGTTTPGMNAAQKALILDAHKAIVALKATPAPVTAK